MTEADRGLPLKNRLCVLNTDAGHATIAQLRQKYQLHVVLESVLGQLVIGFGHDDNVQEIRDTFRQAGVLVLPPEQEKESEKSEEIPTA